MSLNCRALLLNAILFVLVVSQLTSCTPKDSELFEINKNVILKGNLSPSNEKTQIILKYRDLVIGELIQYITFPDDNGDFQLQFLKYNEQDVKIQIDDLIIPLFVFPEKTIQFRINNSNSENPVRFIGSNSKYYSEFSSLKNTFDKYINENVGVH